MVDENLILQGGWDGIGSLVKRHARQTIINNPINCPIRSPHTFYLETKRFFKKMEVFWVPKERIQEISDKVDLDTRFAKSKRIPGTMRLHHFTNIVGSQDKLKAKSVSTLGDDHYKTYSVL